MFSALFWWLTVLFSYLYFYVSLHVYLILSELRIWHAIKTVIKMFALNDTQPVPSGKFLLDFYQYLIRDISSLYKNSDRVITLACQAVFNPPTAFHYSLARCRPQGRTNYTFDDKLS